jgi:hypothetical protein
MAQLQPYDNVATGNMQHATDNMGRATDNMQQITDNEARAIDNNNAATASRPHATDNMQREAPSVRSVAVCMLRLQAYTCAQSARVRTQQCYAIALSAAGYPD